MATIEDLLKRRLNIVAGQVKGLAGLISEQADCRKITTQFYAINSAFKKVMAMYLQDNLEVCLKSAGKKDKKTIDFLIKEIVKNK